MNTGIVLMDVNDVAKALRVSPHTVRRWASQKKLVKVKLGSRTLFDPADVARFVAEARARTATTTTETDENSWGVEHL
jgi:excisionase family DNA binding protein